MAYRRLLLALAILSSWPQPAALAQSEYGFVNTRPSGQPYLSPEESAKRMQVPPGWEVKVFAAEPDIINPIAFTVDERGRLWVVECYEYPRRTPPGKMPRDRIKLLEDSTGSGKADKVTVWAEGKELPRFDMASGIEVGYGGVFLGAAPYLLFLQDTKGAGHCDKHEILLRGFGSQDTHEVLNTLQWGPDGRLYGLHGIFTQSKVGEVKMNAAIWRYNYPARAFDIFAEGTSNPWGLDFDAHGQAFLAACVIPHFFHIIPGGTYIRQAGSSQNPYAYGLLREISDHTHHQESGWAHAGVLVLQGDDLPPELKNSVLMGSIHGCSIKRDILERRGSTYVAHHGADFLVSGDKNFRPINMRWGPDGSIYVIDWHDQNPCHQAAPDSWDMTHGRIYKIQRQGMKASPPPDLSQKSSRELVDLLRNNNRWWHRTALRLLGERRDRSVAPLLEEMATAGKEDTLCLRGLWGLHAVGALGEATLTKVLQHASPWVRSWAVRLAGEEQALSASMLARFAEVARADPSPVVRLQLACTAQHLPLEARLPVLENLLLHKEDAHDPDIPLMIWLAYEPVVASGQGSTLAFLTQHAEDNPLLSEEIMPRVCRRLLATNRAAAIKAAIGFLQDINSSVVRRRALEGLLQGLENRQLEPPDNWHAVATVLQRDPDLEVQRLARRLAVKFHDLQALQNALALAMNPHKATGERVDAVRDLAAAHPVEALRPLQDLLAREANEEVRCEICRTLAHYDRPEVGRVVLKGWSSYPAPVRVEAVNLLAGRKDWAGDLLTAVGRKDVPRTDLNDNTILRIRALRDNKLNGQIEAVWGKVRDRTPAELNALIEHMRTALGEGRGSFAKGRQVFDNQCAKCHRFEGKGHDVGPNLDGAARDIDYLLVNILDPNRVVGQPYYTRFVAFKNGRVETGLLHAEDDRSVTLKNENDNLKVILRKDIDEITVQEKSLMPEGLNKNLTEQDFRDLIRYVMASPFLTDVAVAGPFAEEASVQINKADPLKSKEADWKWPVVGPQGKIPLPPMNNKADQVVYVAAEVTAPEALRSRLQLGTGASIRVWLNGQPIYQGRPGAGVASPDQAGVEVQLRQGQNRLLFQLSYQGEKQALFARLLDPQRKLRFPEP